MQQAGSLQSAQAQSAWFTIGVFDGVHFGHQQILKDLVADAHAHNAPAVVLSFHPHPVETLRGPVTSFYLSDQAEKAALMADLGVDLLITHPFDKETAATSARHFVLALKTQLGLAKLWIGHDFALGHNREGNFPMLQKLGAELGFEVHPVEAVLADGQPISSSRIRALLGEGDVQSTAKLLGRNYALSGAVVSGAKRGRSIGIPTANLALDPKRAVPATGVYVTSASIGERTWGAVTNIGLRPTFADGTVAPIVETHLLDYEGGEFYDEPLRVEFITRLRAEQKFSGVDELVAQIKQDIEVARSILAERS
jgi:riboflavin kinase/FMN adenylyltransferase